MLQSIGEQPSTVGVLMWSSLREIGQKKKKPAHGAEKSSTSERWLTTRLHLVSKTQKVGMEEEEEEKKKGRNKYVEHTFVFLRVTEHQVSVEAWSFISHWSLM